MIGLRRVETKGIEYTRLFKYNVMIGLRRLEISGFVSYTVPTVHRLSNEFLSFSRPVDIQVLSSPEIRHV